MRERAYNLIRLGQRTFCCNRVLTNAVFQVLLLSSLFALLANPLFAAEASDIVGLWNNEEKDGKVRIYQCGKEYCGEVVWTKRGAITDTKNPNPALKNRQVVGLSIMRGFRYAGNGEWRGGEIYDPKTGRTYKGKMWLTTPDRLDMRGYVLIPLLGRTTSWTRLNDGLLKNTPENAGRDPQK